MEQQVITKQQVEHDIYEMLMDILALERDEIRPDARFMADLGGESIDLLEFSFQCEKKYGVRVKFEQMLGKHELELDANGAITAASLRRIQGDYPFLDTSRLPANPKRDQLVDLLTVQAMMEFVYVIVNQSVDTAQPQARMA